MHQFDVIFSDTWDTTRANGRQRFEYQEPWEINAYDAQIWSLYRVLRPQGAFVWYATGREYEGLAQFNVWCHAAWSSNLYSFTSSAFLLMLRPFPLFTPTLRWEPNIFAEFHISKLSGLRPYKGTTYVQKGFDETVLPCGLK